MTEIRTTAGIAADGAFPKAAIPDQYWKSDCKNCEH